MVKFFNSVVSAINKGTSSTVKSQFCSKYSHSKANLMQMLLYKRTCGANCEFGKLLPFSCNAFVHIYKRDGAFIRLSLAGVKVKASESLMKVKAPPTCKCAQRRCMKMAITFQIRNLHSMFFCKVAFALN